MRVFFCGARRVAAPLDVAFLAVDETIIMATRGGEFRIYDPSTHSYRGQFSTNAPTLAVCARRDVIVAIEARSETACCEYHLGPTKHVAANVRRLATHTASTAAITADGNYLVMAVDDEIFLWNNDHLRRRFRGTSFMFVALAGNVAAAATRKAIVVFSVQGDVTSWPSNDITQLAIHKELVVVVRSDAVDLYDLENRNFLRSVSFPGVESLQFLPTLAVVVDKRSDRLDVFSIFDTPVLLASQPLRSQGSLVVATPEVPPHGLESVLVSHEPGMLLELTVRPRWRDYLAHPPDEKPPPVEEELTPTLDDDAVETTANDEPPPNLKGISRRKKVVVSPLERAIAKRKKQTTT